MKEYRLPMDSQADICAEYAKVSGGHLEKTAPLFETYCSASGWYGRNCLEPLSEEQAKEAISKICENMAKGKPALTCYIEEEQPENIADILEAYGFSHFIMQTGMIFDMKKSISDDICTNIVTLDTACVKNEDYLKIRDESIPADRMHEWTEVMTEGFKPEKPLEYDVYDYFAKSKDVIYYAYMDEGKIIGTSMLHLRKENSGIHEVAVPVEYRHRGIATRLVIRLLQDLKKLGKTEATLQASPFGRPVYAALGFEEICHIHSWVHPEQ